MRNGFASVALVCTLPAKDSALRDHLRRHARAGPLAVRAVPARPAEDPRAAAAAPHAHERHLRRYDPGGEGRDPAGLRDPDLRLRRRLSRPDDPRAQRPRGRRPPRNTLTFESNVHLHGGFVPDGHDGHPMDVIPPGGSFEYHYPNLQDAATLWYHDHAHGRTSRTLYHGLLAMYVLEDDLERQLDLPRGDYDVPIVIADPAFNRDGSFRYRERRPRLPRRHDPRQRRGVAAHARAAAQVPPPAPQRLELALVRPAARQRPPHDTDQR